MELISRILDGSIPESLRASLPAAGMFGPRVTQDDKIARLEEVALEQLEHRAGALEVARLAGVHPQVQQRLEQVHVRVLPPHRIHGGQRIDITAGRRPD